jgi:hypothetical protein
LFQFKNWNKNKKRIKFFKEALSSFKKKLNASLKNFEKKNIAFLKKRETSYFIQQQ